MLETLKKRSRSSNLIRAIVSIIVAVALFAFTKFALFDVITGPAKLDITADPATYEGKYVSIDAEFFLNDYVEHTTTTKKKYGGSTTRVDGHSYLAFQTVDDYENQMSTWYFYSVYMDKDEQSSMYTLIDQAWACLEDEEGTTAPPEPLTVKGTWTKMDSQMERYYRESLAELGVTEGEYDIFYFYNLDTSKLGGQDIIFFWVLSAIAVAALLYCVLCVLGLFNHSYIKEINKYLQKDTSASMAAIEQDFNSAHVIGKDLWIGRKWTIYMTGASANILSNKDLIWGYYFQRTGRNSVSEMRLFSKDKKASHISLSEKSTMEALKYYAAEQPQMVVGYTSELDKMYSKDFGSFLNLKYTPAMTAAAADSSYGYAEPYPSTSSTPDI